MHAMERARVREREFKGIRDAFVQTYNIHLYTELQEDPIIIIQPRKQCHEVIILVNLYSVFVALFIFSFAFVFSFHSKSVSYAQIAAFGSSSDRVSNINWWNCITITSITQLVTLCYLNTLIHVVGARLLDSEPGKWMKFNLLKMQSHHITLRFTSLT